MTANSGRFRFDGGAATYLGTGLLAALITIVTLGICYPFAVVLRQRWRAKHTYIEGRQLVFTGSAVGLFGHWIKWFALIIVTLGIYAFWVVPRMTKWVTENTDFVFSPTSAVTVAVTNVNTAQISAAPAAIGASTPTVAALAAVPAVASLAEVQTAEPVRQPVEVNHVVSTTTSADVGLPVVAAHEPVAFTEAAIVEAVATEVAPRPDIDAAWFVDPHDGSQWRWWDGTAWTEHVSRGG